MTIAIDRPDTQSARRARLVAEGVVAGYINDISAGVTPVAVRRAGRERASAATSAKPAANAKGSSWRRAVRSRSHAPERATSARP